MPDSSLLFKAPVIPRWRELPDLYIYMDQLLSLTSRYLEDVPGMEKPPVTSSMVNNYVKAGILPAPKNKKYDRSQLSLVLQICILKNTLPLNTVKSLLDEAKQLYATDEEVHDRFAEEYEAAFRETLVRTKSLVRDTGASSAALTAALKACSEGLIASELMRTKDAGASSDTGSGSSGAVKDKPKKTKKKKASGDASETPAT